MNDTAVRREGRERERGGGRKENGITEKESFRWASAVKTDSRDPDVDELMTNICNGNSKHANKAVNKKRGFAARENELYGSSFGSRN